MESGGLGRRLKSEQTSVCLRLIRAVVQLKRVRCKAVILQYFFKLS